MPSLKRSKYLQPLLDSPQEFVVPAFKTTERISQTGLPNNFVGQLARTLDKVDLVWAVGHQ